MRDKHQDAELQRSHGNDTTTATAILVNTAGTKSPVVVDWCYFCCYLLLLCHYYSYYVHPLLHRQQSEDDDKKTSSTLSFMPYEERPILLFCYLFSPRFHTSTVSLVNQTSAKRDCCTRFGCHNKVFVVFTRLKVTTTVSRGICTRSNWTVHETLSRTTISRANSNIVFKTCFSSTSTVERRQSVTSGCL